MKEESKIETHIRLQDGQLLVARNLIKGADGVDTSAYHRMDLYELDDDTERVAILGYSLSGSAFTSWIWKKPPDTDINGLVRAALRTALPYIELPLTYKELKKNTTSTFIVIKLSTFQTEPYFDADNKVIYLSAYENPERFVKVNVFNKKYTDSRIARLILERAKLDWLNNEMGDGRFFTRTLANELFIDSLKINRAISDLVEDGFIKPLGKATLDGGHNFAIITKFGRQQLEKEELSMTTPPTKNSAPLYISTDIVERLNENGISNFDCSKLNELIRELNDNFSSNNPYACHALLRALLDHIPPIFGQSNFSGVANNYPWSKTDKAYILKLETFRLEADDALHRQITKKERLLERDTMPSSRLVNILLNECIVADPNVVEKHTRPESKSVANGSKAADVQLKSHAFQWAHWGSYASGFLGKLVINNFSSSKNNFVVNVSMTYKSVNLGDWVSDRFRFKAQQENNASFKIPANEIIETELWISDERLSNENKMPLIPENNTATIVITFADGSTSQLVVPIENN